MSNERIFLLNSKYLRFRKTISYLSKHACDEEDEFSRYKIQK